MAKQVVNDFSKGSIISHILRLSIPKKEAKQVEATKRIAIEG